MMIYGGMIAGVIFISLFSSETFVLHWEARLIFAAAMIPIFGRCFGLW